MKTPIHMNNNEIFDQIDAVNLDASLRIVAAKFLNSFRTGDLSLDEAVELVMQFRLPAFRDNDAEQTSQN